MGAKTIILAILEARDEQIQRELDRMIASAPGSSRDEKLKWMWANRPTVMDRLLAGMTTVRRAESDFQRSKTTWKPALRYYIRFGDVPKEGYSQAYDWDPTAKKKLPYKKEPGISAYPCVWNKQHGKWEVRLDSTEMVTGFDSLVCDVAAGKGRPIYLLYGEESSDSGSDLEPMVQPEGLKVVKRLTLGEIYCSDFDIES